MQDYGFRLYDRGKARFLSVDPLAPDFPELTSYQFASNTPIWAIDLDGLEGVQYEFDSYIYADDEHLKKLSAEELAENRWNAIFYTGIVPIAAGTIGGTYGVTYFSSLLTNPVAQAEATEMGMGLAGYEGIVGVNIATGSATTYLASIEFKKPGFLKRAWRSTKEFFGNAGKSFIKFFRKSAEKRLCFTAGTLIQVRNGTKKIEDITADDLVWAYNEKNRQKELRRVVQTFVNEVDKLIIIEVESEKILTTEEHPFRVGDEWVEAKYLEKGSLLTLYDNKICPIQSISVKDTLVTVYNFEVEDLHNYYVTKIGVLVHNTCGAEKLAEFKEKLPNVFNGINAEHFDAAVGDLAGNPIVINGRTFDHLDDIESHMRGLNKKVRKLEKMINKDTFSGETLEEAKELRSSLQNTYDEVYGVLQRARNKYGAGKAKVKSKK